MRTRIALFFAALLLLVNLAVLWIQKGPIVGVIEREFHSRGRELAANLAARAAPHVGAGRGEGVGDLVETFRQLEDVEVAAILLATDDAAAGAPGTDRLPADVARPAPGEVLERPDEGGVTFLAAVPGTGAVARVRLGYGRLSESIRRTGWIIAAIAAAAVGAGALLVFAGANAFTRPIQGLAELARRIRGGDLGARTQVERPDEVGELAAAMNAMSSQLAEDDRRLRAAKAAVEEQNRELWEKGHELAAQTRNLETLVASISEGVLFVDRDGRVAVANRAAEVILDVPSDGLRGRTLAQLALPEADAPLAPLLVEACARAADDERFDTRERVADHLYTVTTVHEPQGGALGVLAVVQDLSKIRALEMEREDLLGQLYQQEKMAVVGLLAASLAHEINTPLGTMLLQTQRVSRELPAGEHRDALGTVEHEILRCREIVRRLLDFSRIGDSRPAPIELAPLVERSISLAQAGLRHKGISIRKSVAPSVPAVHADASQIEQVLMNLIWNAADAMGAGGHIDIRLEQNLSGAVVSVVDEGKGIPAELRDRVFDPFFTTKPRGRGTGLGLAICRRIMEEHGGSIRIRPGRKGGTEVVLHLPVEEADHG